MARRTAAINAAFCVVAARRLIACRKAWRRAANRRQAQLSQTASFTLYSSRERNGKRAAWQKRRPGRTEEAIYARTAMDER